MSEQSTSPETLARHLDQALPPGETGIPPLTSDPHVTAAVMIARLQLPQLSSEVSSRMQEQMLQAYDSQYARYRRRAGSDSHQRRGLAAIFRGALVASLVLIVLLMGLTPSVNASVPGDPLYPVKQFYEKMELAAANTSAARATVYLAHAERRTQEALALLETQRFDRALVSAALSSIEAAANLESDVRASARLRAQVLQVSAGLDFVLDDAQATGLITQADASRLQSQVRSIYESDLLLPPAPLPVQGATATATPVPTRTTTPSATLVEATETLLPGSQPFITPTTGSSHPAPGATHACETRGNSCQSQGVPGGVVSPTRRPENPGGGNATGQGNGSGGQGGSNPNNSNPGGGNATGQGNGNGGQGGGNPNN